VKEARGLADEFKEKPMQAMTSFYAAYIDFQLGKFENALRGFNEALRLWTELEDPNQRFALSWKGILLLEMGKVGEAQEIAVELRDLIQKGMNKKAMRYYHWLEGMIDLKKANYPKAIDSFGKAISLLSNQAVIFEDHANYYNPLAAAYYKAGNLEKAKAEYEKLTSLTTGRTA